MTYPDGATVTNQWDPAGNLVRRTYSDSTDLVYERNAAGDVLTATGVELERDAIGNVTRSNGDDVAWSAGRLQRVTYAVGKEVTYAYDLRGLPTAVTDWTGGTTTLGWDDAGRLTRIDRPDGTATVWERDAAGRVGVMREVAGSTTIEEATYDRDAAGRITRIARPSRVALAMTDGLEAHTYDAANQVAEFSYDPVGRLVDDTQRSFTWDGASRPTGYTANSITVTLAAMISRVLEKMPIG